MDDPQYRRPRGSNHRTPSVAPAPIRYAGTTPRHPRHRTAADIELKADAGHKAEIGHNAGTEYNAGTECKRGIERGPLR